MKKKLNQQNLKKKSILQNSSGFLMADFLFSFVLVLSCGIIIFALTFSLATIEVAQYIIWSSARSYSAANKDREASEDAGRLKFKELSAQYPMLTGVGADGSPWFELNGLVVGDNAWRGLSQVNVENKLGTENRQPWTGASANLHLKLFESIKIPFLGKIATDESVFTFPLRAFILRNPSQSECLNFYRVRFSSGLQPLRFKGSGYVPIEDNGC
jgi:hypothetical protein